MRIVKRRKTQIALTSWHLITVVEYAYARSDWKMLHQAGEALLRVREVNP